MADTKKTTVQLKARDQEFGDEEMAVMSTFMADELCISEVRRQESVEHEGRERRTDHD